MKASFPIVTCDDGKASDDSFRHILGIQTESAELNIWIKPEEVPLFSEVAAASWDNRGSIRIGQCLEMPVYWSSDKDTLSILIGQDDETWDIAFTFPLSILKEIENELHTRK